MNKRIRELLKQAEERYPKHLAVAVPEVVLRQDALEKFAELIVEEMYVFMCDATDNDKPWPTFKEVKQHFGVEE